MHSLTVEHVRCFHERQQVALRPVTLLVGENSSGKSTFLGLIRLAWELAPRQGGLPFVLNFNEEPFAFGSYEQIATYRGGRGGQAKSFVIGFEVGAGSAVTRVEGLFVAERGQPILSRLTVERGGEDAEFDLSAHTLRVKTRDAGVMELPGSPGLLHPVALVPRVISQLRLPVKGGRAQELSAALERVLVGWRHLERDPAPYAFAPIRTRPLRTYDPIAADARPEGSHVPIVLARMAGDDRQAWSALHTSLGEFGEDSGLFEVVDVRRMGRKDSDPFQIRIKIAGPAFNLVDVGYGVSQVLPILVDCSRDKRPRTFLLQQPEVHLHPRAQAALGSWLAALAKAQNKRFVIETHSDHLIDRVRMDVRDGRHLKPADVAILYFERRNGAATIHQLDLDERGNFKRVPDGYRSFFLDEERRMLAG